MLFVRITFFLVLLLSISCGKKIKNSQAKASKFSPSNTRASDKNSFAQEILFLAIETGDENLVRHELEHGANPNSMHKGDTALGLAVKTADIAITRLLVEAGANLALFDSHGKRPLEIAINLGKEEIFVYLISKKALNFYPDRIKLLKQAIKSEQETMAMEIIIDNTVFDMEKALRYTHKKGLRRLNSFLQTVKSFSEIDHLLLQTLVIGGELNQLRYIGNRQELTTLSDGANLLAKSLINRNITTRYQVIEYLLTNGFIANGQPNDIQDPIIEASKLEDLGALKILVSNGGKTQVLDNANKTPLTYAVSNLDWKMVEYLLANGSEKNYMVTSRNRTVIHNACNYLRRKNTSSPYQTRLNRIAYNKINDLLLCDEN